MITETDLILAKYYQNEARFYSALSRDHLSHGDFFLSTVFQRVAARQYKLVQYYMGVE